MLAQRIRSEAFPLRSAPPHLRALPPSPAAGTGPACRLADAVRGSRRTLWREWRRAVGDASPTRLEDVLHWLILARALALKTAERAWCDVAADLRVHPHTLSRFARQFTGLTLRRIAADGDAAAAMERALLPSFRE